MRITYPDVTSVESGFEPPFSQISSMENGEDMNKKKVEGEKMGFERGFERGH